MSHYNSASFWTSPGEWIQSEPNRHKQRCSIQRIAGERPHAFLVSLFSFYHRMISQPEYVMESSISWMWMINVGGTHSSLRCTFCLCSKGMVEVVAENHHNIWAKKKKSDLGSRGDLLMKPIIVDADYIEIHAKQSGRDSVWCRWM